MTILGGRIDPFFNKGNTQILAIREGRVQLTDSLEGSCETNDLLEWILGEGKTSVGATLIPNYLETKG